MIETQEFSITRASQLTIPNKDWTHYRMGLKLRCSTSVSSGVSLEIISQGRCIDVTYLTALNVKFLVKEPVVGLKVFDGDILNKRLQITFASEAHFNYFSNKIQQWVGISLQSDAHSYTDSQKTEVPSERQSITTGHQNHTSTFTKSSQVASQEMSQIFTQESLPQRNTLSSSQNFSTQESLKTSRDKPAPQVADSEVRSNPADFGSQAKIRDESSFHDGLRYLQGSSRMSTLNNFDTSILSQSTDLFSNNTQYNTYSTPGLFLPDSEDTINTSVYSKQQVTRTDLTDSLKALPFDTSRKRLSKSSRSKKSSSMDRILEKTLTHILKEKKKTLLSMDDEELAVNVARKLHSQSFLKLLKRVEHIISD